KPTEVKPTEVKPTEVKPTEVKPTEVKPTEVKPTEVKPTEVKPTTSIPEPWDRPYAGLSPKPSKATKVEMILRKAIDSGIDADIIVAKIGVAEAKLKKAKTLNNKLKKIVSTGQGVIAGEDLDLAVEYAEADLVALKNSIESMSNSSIPKSETETVPPAEAPPAEAPPAEAPPAEAPPAEAPPAEAPPAEAPPAEPVKQMTAEANGSTYEAFMKLGWTDEQLIEHGKMVLVSAPVEAPPAPKNTAGSGGVMIDEVRDFILEMTAIKGGTEMIRVMTDYANSVEEMDPVNYRKFMNDVSALPNIN
ncbi:MAG: Cell envelope opacity-associated protein A, partial [uncultured Thiotrichaceae bacterium]